MKPKKLSRHTHKLLQEEYECNFHAYVAPWHFNEIKQFLQVSSFFSSSFRRGVKLL